MAKKKAKKSKSEKKKDAKKKAKKGGILFLVPFKGMMIKKLKKKGVKFPDKKSKKLENVAKLFHENFLKKRNLEDGFEPAEEYIIDDIVKIGVEILNWIKSLFKKKKNKEPLDKEEAEILKTAEAIDKHLTDNKVNPDDIIDEDGNLADGRKVTATEDKLSINAGFDVKKNLPIIGIIGIGAFMLLKR